MILLRKVYALQNNYLLFMYIQWGYIFTPENAVRKLAPWGITTMPYRMCRRTHTRVGIHARPIICIRMHTQVYFSYSRRTLLRPQGTRELRFMGIACVRRVATDRWSVWYTSYACFLNMYPHLDKNCRIISMYSCNFLQQIVLFDFFTYGYLQMRFKILSISNNDE